jgi:hypothetical protein
MLSGLLSELDVPATYHEDGKGPAHWPLRKMALTNLDYHNYMGEKPCCKTKFKKVQRSTPIQQGSQVFSVKGCVINVFWPPTVFIM